MKLIQNRRLVLHRDAVTGQWTAHSYTGQMGRHIKIRFLLLALLLLMASSSSVFSKVDSEKFSNIEKNAIFSTVTFAAYKKTFSSYWGINWISKPILSAKQYEQNIEGLGFVEITEICKPRNCSNERLVFLFDKKTNRSWGKLFISSDLLGSSNSIEVDRHINSLERK